LPYVDVQQYTTTKSEKKVASGDGFSVGGYWEPWHTATNPGSGSTSDPSYYENDFKNLDSVYYAFLTLDGSPDPDAPHEIYWDESCIYDVETKDCATQDLIWPAKWPNPDAWNGVKINAMYDQCHNNGKKWIWSIGGASDLKFGVKDDQIAAFVDKVKFILSKAGDGVDLDFEHMSSKDGDVLLNTYAKMIKLLRAGLDEAGMQDKTIGYTTRYNAAWDEDSSPDGWTNWNTDGEAMKINNVL